ncbi:multisubstrate pseudouridine synthase 7 [Oleoguttula sp. CCFEE 5521]
MASTTAPVGDTATQEVPVDTSVAPASAENAKLSVPVNEPSSSAPTQEEQEHAHRYTDFLVNEIIPTGEVLHLTEIAKPGRQKQKQEPQSKENERNGKADAESVEVAKTEETASNGGQANGHAGVKRSADEVETTDDNIAKKSKLQSANVEAAPAETAPSEAAAPAPNATPTEATVPAISEAHNSTLVSIFGPETTKSIIDLHAQICSHPHRKPRDQPMVQSEVIPEKSKRTEAHSAIREIFLSKLETLTLQEIPGAISIRAAPPQRGGGRTDVPSKSRGGKNHKGPTSWTELGGEYLHFTLYKENKDTMEVLHFIASQLKLNIRNVQFAGTKDRRGVTVQRVSMYRVRKEQLLPITRMARNWHIGDFTYSARGLELGELRGNEFHLTLRDCKLSSSPSQPISKRLPALRSAVETAAPNFRDKGFVNYYGLQRFGTFSTGTHAVGRLILQNNLEGAVNAILSYQEHLLPSAQAATPGHNIPQDDIDRAGAIEYWRKTGDSREACRRLPRRFQAENSIIAFLGAKGNGRGNAQARDWQGALMSIQRGLRLMYVHAYQSLIWNLVAGRRLKLFGGRVVEGDLVVVGEKEKEIGIAQEAEGEKIDQDGEVVVKPLNEDGVGLAEERFVRARPLSTDEAESGRYDVFDLVLPQPGWDVVYPANEIGEYYKEVMASEIGGGLDPHDMRRTFKDASLSGSYRKIMARPGGLEVEVKTYGVDGEQLVETDVERVMRLEKGSEDVNGGVEVREPGEGDKIAVVLKMQLGSSQYATMALRELTKGGAVAYKPEYSTVR